MKVEVTANAIHITNKEEIKIDSSYQNVVAVAMD